MALPGAVQGTQDYTVGLSESFVAKGGTHRVRKQKLKPTQGRADLYPTLGLGSLSEMAK